MRQPVVAIIIVLLLAGCAFQPLESGRDQILQQSQQRLQLDTDNTPNCDALVTTLIKAMHLALLCNPQVQIAMAELDIGTAELNKKIRIDNPNLDLTIRDSDTDSGVNIELDLLAPVIDLILYPARKSAAQASLDHNRQQALAVILNLANQVESAWYEWQLSNFKANLAERFVLTRQLNAELGERYFEAGNINLNDLSELRIAAGTGGLIEDELKMQRLGAQIKLQRLLGGIQLPELSEPLKILPDSDPDISNIWTLTETHHPLLQAAEINNQALAISLALERRYRFLLDFGAGLSLEQEPGAETLIGPAIELELPLWNQNQAEIAAAEGQLSKAKSQQLALNNHFQAEIQLTLGQMQLARNRLMRYRKQILPSYRTKMDQTLREYNYMLVGPFELLETRAEQMQTLMNFLDDIGSYWQAAAQLSRLSGGAWRPTKTRPLHLDALMPKQINRQQEQDHAYTP